MASDFLTLFVDASHCLQSKSAGWGAWAIRDDWERSNIFGAPISILVDSINDAETFGIAMALQTLERMGDTKDITRFSVQCDNAHALSVLLGACARSVVTRHRDSRAHVAALKPQSTLQAEACRVVRDIVGNRQVFFKHVKGHSSGSGRAWVNTQCDAHAKKYMREAREKHLSRIATAKLSV